MKKQKFTAAWTAALLVFSLTVVTGCDLIRASLGKPTSADLELLRLAEQVRANAARTDTVAMAASVSQETPVAPAADAPSVDSASVESQAVKTSEPVPSAKPDQNLTPVAEVKKYYAVVGAFKEGSGVKKYAELLQEQGFKVQTLTFRNGTTVVCTEGSDNIEDVRKDMAALKEAGIDSWLYNTKQNLHK